MATERPVLVGARVRFTTRAAWFERVGCAGVVVAPPSDDRYPQPGPGEVVVLLDADPLRSPTTECRGWSCVTSIESLEVVDD